ncbi:TIGR01459 family HAD-type hydrolase [Beijerinckia sp. L45]|uniref:TIGR01459 family HAD-type hydrolase n=1 Tax=Beijerinckia sp. L45 TaxID=1641855 RepID=UPI00131EB891|nr:TIGR01459 family HAD-type hydrolase [Beijerinckia sp. L45]
MTSGLDATALPLLDHGLADLAGRYDLILCDVWGVIHNGVTHHSAAVDALQRFRRGGGTVVLITNAPAPARNVVARMDSLGVPHDAYDAIATSGDVTVAMIVEAGCPPLLNIGPEREVDLYREAGLLGAHGPTLVGVEEAELVICISPSDRIGRQPEDYDALLRSMLARKLTMICANPDIVVEVGDTLEYCAGAIAERYEAIGGTVIQAGKPFPAIYERALGLTREKLGDVATSRILAIGDAMHTDMQGARDQGIDGLFITSGIHRAELHGDARSNPLDRAALRQFLASRDARPRAALGTLTWAV